MRKFIITISTSLLFSVCLVSNAFSYTFGIESFSTIGTNDYDYGRANASSGSPLSQGSYLGTVYDANDSVAVLADFLLNFKGWDVSGLSFYGKDEDNDFLTPLTQSIGGDIVSGTWETNAFPVPPTPDTVEILVVKGGSSFSVHYYDPAASSGTWNVGYLDDAGGSGHPPELSHYSGYNGGTAPVPEPATMLLFGTGLLGLVGVRLRKKKK